jgi:putative tryptophan/tyrosine transport system substrate-binding protein
LNRRNFIAIVGSAIVFAPRCARAQSQRASKPALVGFMVPGSQQSSSKWVAAFAKRMAELGWTDGRNVTLVYRWAEGHAERYAQLAAELADLHVDVFVTSVGGPVVAAFQQVAPDTPIVYTTMVAQSPFIASLSHPGGMVTGLSQVGPELGGKRLQLLSEIVGKLRHVAVLGFSEDSKRVPETAEIAKAADKLGIEVIPVVVEKADEIAPAISSLKGRVEALYVVNSPFINVNRVEINARALEARLPTMHGVSDYARSGGLLAYGPSFEDLYRRAADYVDKILHGARPADLPVEQPTKFDLLINLKTARALELTIPAALLTSADEVIE